MVTEIRIYVEGGGEGESRADFRTAFSEFLQILRDRARRKRIGWKVVVCGSRSETFGYFRAALKNYPDALVLLLVDAETPVTRPIREHLADSSSSAHFLRSVSEHQCHMMVQLMESWFLADPEWLAAFYGQGFAAGALPRTQNVEQIAKETVFSSLKNATRNTRKGEYHQTRHAPTILGRLDAAKVRARAPHCERLFAIIEQHLT